MSNTVHFETTHTFELDAPPDVVFPLLCPVREHDWIPTWSAQVVSSRSGFAELDCVFDTESDAERKATSATGASYVNTLDPEMAAKATQRLAALLDYYLDTGTMLEGQ